MMLACSSRKLYLTNNRLSGTFTRGKADSIRNYLTQISNEKIQDTVFIKYEFNGETCWSILDGESDKYIAGVIQSANDYTQRYKNAHPNVTVLRIKESGKNFNKLVLRNPKMIVDSGYLRQNVFLNTATCGTSMKLYPNGNYEFMLSDAHFKILDSK
ncbi:hypothetical protein GJU39_00460 [Pedobacter petrophilus]|uniref:Uncharacterized protein n=1 Tax=Pedobacter petrophilus TaxID=1908241 RepID=A0A7K0FTZ1_9SPHI|nr:hypothetical protein [Pedobacter petrophilus]MRX74544.1 hypothetical protein [Pedobacter petrophilus]